MAKATTNGKEHYTQLERRLVLLRWLCHQLGYADNREALADTKSVAEGFESRRAQLPVPSPAGAGQ
jgi:hypothetical protein